MIEYLRSKKKGQDMFVLVRFIIYRKTCFLNMKKIYHKYKYIYIYMYIYINLHTFKYMFKEAAGEGHTESQSSSSAAARTVLDEKNPLNVFFEGMFFFP